MRDTFRTLRTRLTGQPILVIGTVLAMAWLVCCVLAWTVPKASLDPYRLGSHVGFLPVQLLTYSFLVSSLYGLLIGFFQLFAVVIISKDVLSADGFVRMYSVGTIGGGFLLYVLTGWLMPEAQGDFSGPWVSLVTMLSAIAVLSPQYRGLIFGDRIASFVARRPGAVFLWLFALYELSIALLQMRDTDLGFFQYFQNYSFHWWKAYALVEIGILVQILRTPLRVRTLIALIVLPDVLLMLLVLANLGGGAARGNLVFLLAEFTAIAVGVVYGFAERKWGQDARHRSRQPHWIGQRP
jgi:hypothetical protein